MLSAWRDATTRPNRSELIWICDAGIYVEPNTLLDMVSRVMTSDKVAVCHGMPFTRPRPDRTFGELVEKTYFGINELTFWGFPKNLGGHPPAPLHPRLI